MTVRSFALPGQIGDVMQESVQAALSYVKSQANKLKFDPSVLEDDIHVHVPAGAIPKDGAVGRYYDCNRPRLRCHSEAD